MNNNKLILITHSFPFGNGEMSFIYPEYTFLKKNFDITIITENIKEKQTSCFDCESIFRYDHKKNYNFFELFLRAIFSGYFWQELFFVIIKEKKYKSFKQCLSIMMRSFHFSKVVRKVRNGLKCNTVIFYSYWNGFETLSCFLSKKQNDRVVSRIHGGDLYLKKDNLFYQPYKNIINKNIDRLFFISEEGIKYYQNTFNKLEHYRVSLSRLGVFYKGSQPKFIFKKKIRIITISRIFWVKRIDKLIDALSDINTLNIEWTHIGDGELKETVFAKAKELLDKKDNISYSFIGNLSNDEVIRFLNENVYDFIINTSFSEGLPVSIMEAMSFGIPAIAVSVGGIPEIVKNGWNGFLMDKNFTNKEFEEILKKYNNFTEKEKNNLRINAYKMWKKRFNAELNFRSFSDELMKIIGQ